MIKSKRAKLYVISILSAVEVIVAFSAIGNIGIGDAVVTLAVAPVMAAAMLLGPAGAGFIGLLYGITSMWKACSFFCEGVDKLFSPIESGNALHSFILAVVVRIIFGIVAGFIFRRAQKTLKDDSLVIPVAASLSLLFYAIVFYTLMNYFFGGSPLYSETVLVTLLDFALNLTASVIILTIITNWLKSERMVSLFESIDENNSFDMLNRKLKFYVTAVISAVVVITCGLISLEFFNKTRDYFDHSSKRYLYYIMTSVQFYIAIVMAVFILAIVVRYYAFFTLSESERTMSMINMIPGGVCIIEVEDEKLSTVFVSDGIKDLLGISREAKIITGNKDPFDYCHPEDVDMIKGWIANFDPDKEEKGDMELFFRLRNKTKGFIWVSFSTYMGQKIGSKLRFYGIILDADNQVRRKNELELRYFESILANEVIAADAALSFELNLSKNTCDLEISNLPQKPAWIDDIDTVDMLFKRASERNTSMDAMLGYKKLFDRQTLLDEFEVGKSSVKFEHNFLIEDNNIRWCETRVVLFFNPENNDIEGHLNIRDIDDQKNTKIINERILSGVFEYVELINIEDDSVKMFMTKYPERFDVNMTGLTYTTILEHHLYKMVDEREVQDMRVRLSLATIVRELEKKSVYTCSFTIREKGIDSRKMFQFQYLDRFNKRIIFTQSDITDIYNEGRYKDDILKDAVKEAEEAKSARAEFVARVSHDIRTPLNDILGLSHIAMQEQDIERVREYLGKINMLGEVLHGIADDIVDNDESERGYSELHLSPGSLSSCIADVQVMFNPQIQEKGLVFIYTPGAFMDIPLSMDKAKVRQVLGILLSNAIMYNVNEGKIWLTIEQKVNKDNDNCISTRFIVKDTGVGMSEEFLSRAFEPFASESGGKGIGLSIAKKLVDIMEGTISLSSKKGEGTTAVVELEFKEANYDHAANDESHGEFNLSGKRILLVEDNMINAEMAMILLEQAGMKVEMADNGLRAVEKFLDMPSKPRYDAVLMDIQMPVLDGIKASKSIRSLGSGYTEKVPIIAMTANAFNSDANEAMEAGMNGYITKPINPKELFKILDEEMSKSGIVSED
ncbi:MAG: response regulator [Lachnospiraceae bacterium]|nr:response regulator [Lachnospiraceae bacterium]